MPDQIDPSKLGSHLANVLADQPAAYSAGKALRKKRGSFLTCFIAAFVLVVLVAAAALYINVISVDRFESALLANVDIQALRTDEQSVSSFATETIYYLTNRQANWNPQIVISGFPASSFIPQSFRDHMATVKGWVSSATAIFLSGAAIVLLLLGRALTGSGKKSGVSLGGYYLGALAPLLLIGAVGLWAYLDFDGMWALLHEFLIPDGIFNAGELIMQLFPESLFAAYLSPVVQSFLLFMAGVLVLPLILAPLSALIVKSKRAGKKSTTASK